MMMIYVAVLWDPPVIVAVIGVPPMNIVETHLLLTVSALSIICGCPPLEPCPDGVSNFSCATRSVKSLVRGSMTLSVVLSVLLAFLQSR